MLTRQDIIEYRKKCGASSAVNLLLLAGPDGFDGDIYEYNNLINNLNENASDIDEMYVR